MYLVDRECRLLYLMKISRHSWKLSTVTNRNIQFLIDKYLVGKEVEVDAVCDGTDILIPGIMEHVERAGIHSGDSISVYPSINLTDRIKRINLQNIQENFAKSLHVYRTDQHSVLS